MERICLYWCCFLCMGRVESMLLNVLLFSSTLLPGLERRCVFVQLCCSFPKTKPMSLGPYIGRKSVHVYIYIYWHTKVGASTLPLSFFSVLQFWKESNTCMALALINLPAMTCIGAPIMERQIVYSVLGFLDRKVHVRVFPLVAALFFAWIMCCPVQVSPSLGNFGAALRK